MSKKYKFLILAIISGFIASVFGSKVIGHINSPAQAYMTFFVILSVVLLLCSIAETANHD